MSKDKHDEVRARYAESSQATDTALAILRQSVCELDETMEKEGKPRTSRSSPRLKAITKEMEAAASASRAAAAKP